jgi:HK97 family phage major capsid protein
MTVGDFPVFLPGNNVFGRPTDTILGMPAFESEHCEALGTKGDIYLVDWSEYLTIQKGANFAESMHLYFDTDRTAFRITLRVDGQPWWETYVTLANSVTKSPYVTLETRS